jgi:DNA-binding LacI/PurR family transcriptional regulator
MTPTSWRSSGAARLNGIILLEIQTDDRRPEILRNHGYPFVMIGHRADKTGRSFADFDIEHGVGLAMEHLVGLGHRRIGFLTIETFLRPGLAERGSTAAPRA